MIPEAGTKIGGRYVLREKISEGGGGIVWKAENEAEMEKEKTYVALKVLKLSPFKAKEPVADRFKREFELFKKVSHPNIARIHDFGFDQDLDVYYFTSEILPGGDLRKMIGAPVPAIERLLLQSLRALEYLRNFGILHLDIKPQNLLLRGSPSSGDFADLALIDFGLAGFNPPERPGGTPNYMPPEVVLKRFAAIEEMEGKKKSPGVSLPIDHRSDLYSLGVAFYYVLSGIQPFAITKPDGRLDTDATMQRHLSDDRPAPPSQHNSQVPKYLDDIIMRMMAKNPNDRYQSAMLAAQALCFRSPNRLEPESKETISAYIPEEGMLIGRHEERKILENMIHETAKGLNQSLPVVCIVGAWGTGKTRLLQSLKPFAQQQEMEVVTDLKNQNLDLKRATAFLIDDPFLPQASIDIASVPDIYALRHLVRYILQMPKARYFLAVALNPDLMPLEDMLRQMELNPSLCTIVNLKNFTVDELTEYLDHLLGEKPSERIVQELHQATFGNPRFIVDFFKRMMKRGEFFSYFAGRPGVDTLESLSFSFSHAASPPSLSEHLLELVRELPRGAKTLCRRLACWQRPATIGELFLNVPSPLAGEGGGEGDLASLLSSGLVRRSEENGRVSFVNPLASKIIEAGLDPKERAAIHDSIVRYLKKITPLSTFEIDRHIAFGSDPVLQKDAVRRFAVEALKKLHPAETSELLQAVFNQVPPEEWDIRMEILVREGQALARLGRWDDAKSVFERLRTLSKEEDAAFKLDLRANEQLGLLSLRRREVAEARSIFSAAIGEIKKKSLENNPEYAVQTVRLENYLAGVDLRDGHYEEAAGAYKRTRELASKLPLELQEQITNNELGETYIFLGKGAEALEILSAELKNAEKADQWERIVNRLRLLGDACRRLDDLPAAIGHYQKALDLSQKYHLFEHQLRIRNSYANLLLHMRKWPEAIEQYKPALNLAMQLEGKATCVDIMANIGFTYNRIGHYDDAIEYLELALDFAKGPEAESSAQVRQSMPHIHVALGNAHYERKEYDEAERHLKIALEVDEKNPLSVVARYNLHGTLAEIDIARGDLAKARKRLPILEKLAVDFPEAAKHLKGLREKIK